MTPARARVARPPRAGTGKLELQVQQQALRIFQRVLHGDQAQHGFAAVDDAVVVGQAR